MDATPRRMRLRAGRNELGVSEGLAAAIFYVALAALVGGVIVLARGAVERNDRRNRLAIVMIAAGLLAMAFSLGFYMMGPRRMLPF